MYVINQIMVFEAGLLCKQHVILSGYEALKAENALSLCRACVFEVVTDVARHSGRGRKEDTQELRNEHFQLVLGHNKGFGAARGQPEELIYPCLAVACQAGILLNCNLGPQVMSS